MEEAVLFSVFVLWMIAQVQVDGYTIYDLMECNISKSPMYLA